MSTHDFKILHTEKLVQSVPVSLHVHTQTTHTNTHTFTAPYQSYTEQNRDNSRSTGYTGCVSLVDKEYRKIIQTLWEGGKMESGLNEAV